jgi:hypothetical protein
MLLQYGGRYLSDVLRALVVASELRYLGVLLQVMGSCRSSAPLKAYAPSCTIGLFACSRSAAVSHMTGAEIPSIGPGPIQAAA